MAIPANPTKLIAKYEPDAQAVTVSFTVVLKGLTEIKWQRHDSVTNLYTDLTTTPPQPSYFFDTSNLADGVTYTYRALSIGPDGSPRFYSAPSNSVTIIDPPAQVTELVATPVSPTRNLLKWVNNPTLRAPYLYHYIRRWNNVDKKYIQINRIGGNLSSYEDYSVPADRALAYHVWTSNKAGGAPYTSDPSGVVYSKPNKPSKVTAKWSGSNVVVSIVNASTIAAGFEIEQSVDGIVWDAMADLGQVTSWVHVAPEHGVDRTYRVRAVSPTPSVGNPVRSDWTYSALIPGRNTPFPPTVYGPAYGALSTSIRMEYLHQPSTPNAPQTAVRLRYRPNGSTGAWTQVSGDVLPAQTGTAVEVQMATSSGSSSFSDWSTSHVVQLRTAPTFTFVSPANNQVIQGPVVPVSWTSNANAMWELELREGSVIADFKTGTSEKSATLTAEDLSTYTVRGRAFDGYLWSTWQTRTITTKFSSESAVPVTVVVDDDYASVSLSARSAGAVRYEYLRRREGDIPWVAVGVSFTGSFIDQLAPLRTDLEYTVVAWTSSGVASTSSVVTARIENLGVIINYGPALSEQVLVNCGFEDVQMTVERDLALHSFAKRTYPVEVLGTAMNRTASVTGTLYDRDGDPNAAIARWEDMLTSSRKWYRDFTGLSFLASIPSLGNDRAYYTSSVSITATEISA